MFCKISPSILNIFSYRFISEFKLAIHNLKIANQKSDFMLLTGFLTYMSCKKPCKYHLRVKNHQSFLIARKVFSSSCLLIFVHNTSLCTLKARIFLHTRCEHQNGIWWIACSVQRSQLLRRSVWNFHSTFQLYDLF